VGVFGQRTKIRTYCKQTLERLHLDEVNNTEDTGAEIKEPAPDAVTSVVHILNQLNLEISTQDEDELSASHSEPMSIKDLTDMHEANQVPSEAHHSCQSPSTRLLTVKTMNYASAYLESLPNIMEEYNPNGDKSSQFMELLTQNTACYRLLYQEQVSEPTFS
jgi:hypothetical protein